MNLDLVPLGWVHLAACLVAIAVAMIILARAKGTPVHKRRGRVYVVAILVASGTALGIYRLGIFFFAHWFAIASLATTAIAFAAARFKFPRRGWVHVHLTFMLISVCILLGGGVNEVFLRVTALHSLVPNLNSPIVGATHLALQLLFAALIGYYNGREWRHRSSPAMTEADANASARS